MTPPYRIQILQVRFILQYHLSSVPASLASTAKVSSDESQILPGEAYLLLLLLQTLKEEQ
jgi:hypothetical protein